MSRSASDMQLAPSPRNHWRALQGVLDALSSGQTDLASHRLERIRYSPTVPAEAIAAVTKLIDHATNRGHIPSDRLSVARFEPGRGPRLQPLALRSLKAEPPMLRNWPAEMVLPPLLGNTNDFRFLTEALAQPSLVGPVPALRLKIICAPATRSELAAIEAAITQSGSGAKVLPGLSFAIFTPSDLSVTLPFLPDYVRVYRHEGQLWQLPQQMQPELTRDAEVLLFVPPMALTDDWLSERVLRLAALSPDLCQVLTWRAAQSAEDGAAPPGILSVREEHEVWRRDAAAFLRLRQLAFAVSATRFSEVGGFDPRYVSMDHACRDLAYRLHDRGAYFMPHAVRLSGPKLETEPHPDAGPPADLALFRNRCPHPAVRSQGGAFEVPKVSIYIPAFKAERFIIQAIDSVLEQDFSDLEVCVADDGSPDATLSVLQRYGDDPRVRVSSGRNGGIGHASNRAVRMTRGLYVGQLDSDDRLKPGALRRLVEVLDAEPDIGCVYSSCERIGPQGNILSPEYSWPVFSREKMMLTSIAHHFRMFRRQAWQRTAGFREDIANAIDYDMFLKLSEVTEFRHVDEILYQRRWHGQNTSLVNAGTQTLNTHRVQAEALGRMGLDRDWAVHLPDPGKPRQITYRRRGQGLRAIFWPDYSRSNPYQRLLYSRAASHGEIVGGDIDIALAALRALRPGDPSGLTFHLHWLNKVFADCSTLGQAADRAAGFLKKLQAFRMAGGRLVWTIHNTVSHDLPFPQVERGLAREIVALADAIHVHSAGSLPQIAEHFPVPAEKLHIHRHGSYVGIYPDFCDRTRARAELGLDPQAEVMLFLGQIRPYKGLDALIAAFAEIAPQRPRLHLLLAGRGESDAIRAAIPPELQPRVHVADRFIEDMELQLFFRAADFSVFPYRNILTSGSLLLSLSFALPAILPDFGMTRDLLADGGCGLLYDPSRGKPALTGAIRQMLARLDAGEGPEMAAAANRRAVAETWEDIGPMLFGVGE